MHGWLKHLGMGQSNCVKRCYRCIWMRLGSLPACQVDGRIENLRFYAFGSLDVSVHFISRQSGTKVFF